MEAAGLTKRYGDVLAVDDLTLTIPPGEVFGFVGPNGAGKSTTMRMLLGLVAPTSGSARIAGHPAGSPAALASCGALIEGPGFYPYLTGRRNLQVIAHYRRLPSSAVAETLETVGLADRADDKYGSYSLGMKQRLGVGAALLSQPPVLILDEPTNGLDPAGLVAFRQLIADISASGKAVMLSSHVLSDIEQVCDRIGVINDGRLVADSAIADVPRRRFLRVSAEPADKALSVLRAVVPAERVVTRDGAAEVLLDGDSVADLNRALVDGGVDVTELRVEAESLEEVFLRLTGTPTDAVANSLS